MIESTVTVQSITKRHGEAEPFNAAKIYRSLARAFETAARPVTAAALKKMTAAIVADMPQDTEAVADAVEAQLDAADPAVARCYHAFRQTQNATTDAAKDLNHSIQRLLSRDKTVVNENANKDSEVFNTQRDLTAGMVAKTMGLKMLPPAVANAHLKGDIHWHDLDYQPYSPMTNCCLIDFKGMLAQGFKIGNATMGTPQSIQTAVLQMAQIIASVASSQYGGCSSDRTDEMLAPYAQKNFDKHLQDAKKWIATPDQQRAYAEEKTRADIYQAMESLEYQINTLYSSQGQTPFTTVGFGLGTSWVEREIQKAILNVRIKGLGKDRRTAIFPKLVFTIKRGLNLMPQDPNYDIKQQAILCATKRMYPDVLMYDQIVKLTGSFKAPMGCRSFLQGWRDENGVEVNAGRMNLGVVTINLPRIALESGGDAAQFWGILQARLNVAHEALVYKIARAKEASPKNAPTLYQYGAFGERLGVDGDVDELFRNGRATASLGYIGLYEVGTVFFGPNWEKDAAAKQFTLDVVKHLYDACKVWEAAEGYHYSVYATPSESLTDRFCRLDREKFGSIKDITDKDYYTNSFHYDVRKSPTPFEKLDFEKDYPQYSAGGFIHYCEYPNLKQNPKALEAVWDFAYDRVGYLGTNTPIDQCFKCDFKGEFVPTARGFKCPQCGNADPATCDVVKRTCGYLGNPNQRPMVHGRHEEIVHRKKHLHFGLDQLHDRQ